MCPARVPDDAAAEMLGVILLIAVIALVVGIIGVGMQSQPLPQKIPSSYIEITNLSTTIYLKHMGGDPLPRADFTILMNGIDMTSGFTGNGTDAIWNVGETLTNISSRMPQDVIIVYNNLGTGAVVIASQNLDPGQPIPPNFVLAPVADFIGSPTVGVRPLNVQFNDVSTGSPTSWEWNFGDIGGVNTSTSQNPSHIYTSAGTYSVNLTVINDGGVNTLIKPGYITVNIPAPVAAFTGAPLSGTAPLPVTFSDTSTNIPTGWKWSFTNITPGNNTVTEFSTLQNPVMTFGVGNYSIVLNASNSQGFNVSTHVTFVNVSRKFSELSYYREISVTNSPAIANYQMVVNVPYYAHMKTDFGDIRFMGSDGTTVYDYWMEKKTDGSSAVFWVNVPTASTTVFRMYYGNSSLTTTSDGTKAFDFFDDFSGDLSKWTVEKTSGVYPRIESGYLVAGGGTTSDPYGHTSLGSSPTYNVFQDGIVEFKHQHATDGIGEVAFRGNFALNRGYKGRWDARTGNEQIFLMPPYSGWANIGTAIPKWVTVGPWHDGKMIVHGNIMDLYDDGTFKGTVTDTTYTLAGEIAIQNHYGSYTNYDDVRVRKYAAPEPTTSIGSEITV